MKVKYFKRYANIHAEIKAIKQVLKSGWLTTGARVKEFEEKFAVQAGYKYAIAVNSATSGLLLALQTSGIPKGATIATSVYTFAATAHAIEQSEYILKFVDINKETYCLNEENITNEIFRIPPNSNIKAILDIELAGYDEGNQEKVIIKDCAHSLPNKIAGKVDPSIVRVYSFYCNKNLSLGEGGMICTNDEDQVKKIRILMNHGIDRDSYSRFNGDTSKKWQYDIIESGYKFNMPDIIAAIGIEQLKLLDKIKEKRFQVVKWYLQYLDLNKVDTQKYINSYWWHSRHLFLIKVSAEKRDYIIDELSKAGIETSVHYKPLHMMTYFKNKYGFKDEDFPNAYNNYLQTISLPIYPDLKKSEVKYICKVLNSLI